MRVSVHRSHTDRHKRMKDLIIGCFTNYGWSTVQYWANSVDTCGFNGDRALVFYNADAHTIDRLESLRFDTYGFDPATNHREISLSRSWRTGFMYTLTI